MAELKRILVTGGAGFIGSHVVDSLLEAGYDVAVVDNLCRGKRENVHPGARLHCVDVCDARALEEVFVQERPDAVCHQAALADVRASLADPIEYARVNVLGTLNLLVLAQLYGVRKFVLASTGGAIYGDPAELPATEACPPRPLDPYGVSKLACEHYLFSFGHNHGLGWCVLRYANVYGPRQDAAGEAGVVAIFAGRMIAGRPCSINGDGEQVRDFVYVSDVARANVLAVQRGEGVYNIGTGVGASVRSICSELARLTGCEEPAAHGPAKVGEVRATWLDVGKAGRELGWRASVPLAEGLARTVEAMAGKINR
jgi:UDP-glucose 4-epimerase